MSGSVITDPPRVPLVAPSILSADFAHLADECSRVLAGGADLLHLDVMDGHFVPNLTMGPAVCASLRKTFPDVTLDVHLMVESPSMFVGPFAEAGADNLTFHIEAVSEPTDLARHIRASGMTAGLAVNPPTPVEQVLPHVDAFDLILIMSVNPGFSGQSFIEATLEKTRIVASRLRESQRLEMDGGINPETASACREAGCDLLVAASAVFGAADYATVIGELRGAERRASFRAST